MPKPRPLPYVLSAAAFLLLCRLSPGFCGEWTRLVIVPAAMRLSALTARAPFPLLETAALAAAGCTAALALSRRPARALYPPAAILCALLLLWYPACLAPHPAVGTADTPRIEALCAVLIDHLNGRPLEFPAMPEALEAAERAASAYTGRAIAPGTAKAVRYPEWMDALGISGLYSPWTAEALVHPRIAPPLRIFTACHELMHLLGVADEGGANIAAWEACSAYGSAAADSADMQALVYAMRRMRAADETAWRGLTLRMNAALTAAFSASGGYAAPPPDAWLPGTGASDYDLLADRLAHTLIPD